MPQIFQLENHAVCSYSEAQLTHELVFYTKGVSEAQVGDLSETRSEGFNFVSHEVQFDGQ